MTDRSIGTGAVGLHDARPIIRKRPGLCAEHGHPGVTFHPREDKTWCLCGEVIRDGNHHTHAACCGGPLSGDADYLDLSLRTRLNQGALDLEEGA